MWTKLGKSGNPTENSNLATALAKAKSHNIPKEKIEAAINKGLGKNIGNIEYATYELNGPLKVSFVVDTASDSRNRIVANLRSWATRRNGSLLSNGSLSFLFRKHGIIEVEMGDKSEDQIMEAALNAGAMNVEFPEDSGMAIIECEPVEDTVWEIRLNLEQQGLHIHSASVHLIPSSTVDISEAEDLELFKTSYDALASIEGVETISHNANVIEDESEEL